MPDSGIHLNSTHCINRPKGLDEQREPTGVTHTHPGCQWHHPQCESSDSNKRVGLCSLRVSLGRQCPSVAVKSVRSVSIPSLMHLACCDIGLGPSDSEHSRKSPARRIGTPGDSRSRQDRIGNRGFPVSRPNRESGIPSPFPGKIGNRGNGNWGVPGLTPSRSRGGSA
jgi:hypothetical protein